MPRTTSTIPDDLLRLVEGSVAAGVFENKSDAVRHVLREFFEENADVREAAAVQLYDDEEISLGRAARLAGIDRKEMVSVLGDHGIEVRLGPADMTEADREIEVARDLE